MKFLVLFLFFSAHAFSIEPMDNYYANDLLDAVDQAKSSPHHYDYSNNYRYKRTTAQSIELNRLDLNELDETRLKVKPTLDDTNTNLAIADELNIESPEAQINTSKQGNKIQTYSPSINPDSYYRSNQMKMSTTGLINQSTVRSTTRP